MEEVQIVLVQSTFDLITSQDNIKRFKPNASNKETKIQEKNQVDRATYANTKTKKIYENREA